MSSHSVLLRSASAVVLTSALGACGLTVVGEVAPTSDAGLPETRTDGETPMGMSETGAQDGAADAPYSSIDAGAPDAPTRIRGVYVNTTTTVHHVDGTNGLTSLVFTFGGSCTGINVGDIAIDRAGTMFAVTLPMKGNSDLHRVDRATGACGPTLGDLGRRCSGLTSAPHPDDPTRDILYASCATELYRIDSATAEIAAIGPFGSGLSSSGDIVWLPGEGLFATLKASGLKSDLVSRIDIATGTATTLVADVGAKELYGLAHRGAVLIAFGNGVALTIHPTSGATAPFSFDLIAYGAATEDR